MVHARRDLCEGCRVTGSPIALNFLLTLSGRMHILPILWVSFVGSSVVTWWQGATLC